MMKKIIAALLVCLMVATTCYAQKVTGNIDANTYYAATKSVEIDVPENSYAKREEPQHDRRGRHNRGDRRDRDDRHDRGDSHDRGDRHDRDDRDNGIDGGDIIAGIIIYEILKDVLD